MDIGGYQLFMKVKSFMLNKHSQKLMVLLLSIFLISGCYNNSHIRTQRIIKKDEPVVSAHAGLNVISPDYSDGSYELSNSGVSGLRVGISYIGLHRGFEQGLNIGLGSMEDGVSDFILGYDIRKPKYNSKGKPYRYGLYLESNYSYNDESDYGPQGGLVFQIRPYIITITSDQNNWYGGFHGLMSFGYLTAFYDSWEYLDYNISSIGAGITLGNELRSGKFMLQSQLDISVLNQNHVLNNDDIQWDDWQHPPQPLDNTGLVVSIGLAIHRAPKDAHPKAKRMWQQTPNLKVTPIPIGAYDPLTGHLRTPLKQPTKVSFDPLTGEIIQESKAQNYDPYTGQTIKSPAPIEKISPYSLLSAQEQSNLLIKGLKITTLNGTSVEARILDVLDQGLLIERQTNGKSIQEILFYNRINRIKFEGPRKGLKGGLQSAMKGCGLGVGLPLALSIFTAEPDFMLFSFLAVPPAVLGGLIFGSMNSERYDLKILKGNSDQSDSEYSKQLILKVITLYLKSGFPKYDLNQQVIGAKP